MAKGAKKAVNKADNIKIKDNQNNKKESQQQQQQQPYGNRSPFASFWLKCSFYLFVLYLWKNVYTNKYRPYKQQNAILSKALEEPNLIKKVYKVSQDNNEEFHKFMDERDEQSRVKFFERIFNITLEETTDNSVVDDDEEVPIKETKKEVPIEETKKEIPPEEDNDVEVIGDMREEIMGGEIYTVDEIFKKLGIEKTSEYKPEGEYERNLLKEFRIDREMPENVARKADYFKPVIERGLKEDERFFVKKINDKKGYGLFAQVDIVPNEVLGIYSGVIHATDAEKGKKYEWYYSTMPDRKLEKMVELRVNAKHEGSHLRFVNHSLYYNSRVEYVPYNNQWYILFISNRYINRGEEITVNYRDKTKRMPSKIIDKWDKVEEEEIQKLYDEYMKLKAQHEAAEQQEQQKQEKPAEAEAPKEEKKASAKEEL